MEMEMEMAMAMAMARGASGGVRVRLRFEDGSILSGEQAREGYGQCWMVVGPHLPSIADIASHILSSFCLHDSCPHGISLHMDNFLLPSAESACVLKDKDLVSVKRKGEGSANYSNIVMKKINDLHAIEGERKAVTTGVKLLAIDEFEKETGGYQSEEEDVLESCDEDSENVNAATTNHLTCKQRFKKKRKLVKGDLSGHKLHKKARKLPNMNLCQEVREDGLDDTIGRVVEAPGRNFEMQKQRDLEANEMAGKHAQSDIVACKAVDKRQVRGLLLDGCKLKHQRQHCKNHCQDAEFGVQSSKLVNAPAKRISKRRTAGHKAFLGTMKNAVKSLRNNKSAKVEYLLPVKERTGKAGKILHAKGNCGKEMEEINQKSKGADIVAERRDTNFQSTQQGARTEPGYEIKLDHPAGREVKKTPSRSSLRKKAKRKWKREHANIQLKSEKGILGKVSQGDEKDKDNASSLPKAVERLSTDKVEGDDIEAEEEILPVVVRPGHIRFGSYDGSEDDAQAQDPMAIHCWKDGMSKRKGQRWGQERSSEKLAGKNSKMISMKECFQNSKADVTRSISLDQFPSLNNIPKEGDLLSYRMVELTSSWCPELSDYRVGQVVSFESSSNVIKLALVPGYPLKIDASECDDKISNEHSLYNEDGSLEVNFSSLVDVRLINGIEQPYNMQQAQAQCDPNISSTSMECLSIPVHNLTNEASEDDEHKGGRSLAEAAKTEKDAVTLSMGIVPLTCSSSLSQGIEINFASALQELSRTLQKKKEELVEKNEQTHFERESLEIKENVRFSLLTSNKEEKGKSMMHRRSSAKRSLRAAALGPTMNFLRTQNAL